MTNWGTVASLATAGGTLVLAVATFASVRSANRSTRLSEVAFQEQLRPMLVHSHLDDPLQRIRFGDGHWVEAAGSGAAAEEANNDIYLALSIRNAGAGIAVLQAWFVWPEQNNELPATERFRAQARDFYIPPGGIGMWQGRLRDPAEDLYAPIRKACTERTPFSLDLLYTDNTGGQRTVSRFMVTPASSGEGWSSEVVRIWHLDRPGPR